MDQLKLSLIQKDLGLPSANTIIILELHLVMITFMDSGKEENHLGSLNQENTLFSPKTSTPRLMKDYLTNNYMGTIPCGFKKEILEISMLVS